jgi:glycosyltransferase involved in cell wall biosynthesis
MKRNITAIILNKNEELNLSNCIKSIKEFVEEIYVIDDYSSDNSKEIVLSLGAKFVPHKYEFYSQQFNWALENLTIRTEWILRIDADEVFNRKIFQEFTHTLNNNNDVNGFSIEANMIFLNKKLNFGPKKKHKVMFFKYKKGFIEKIKRDAHTIVEGKVIKLKSKFDHHDFKSISIFIDRYNKYSTLEVEDQQNRKAYSMQTQKQISRTRSLKFLYYRFPILLRSFLYFFYVYLFRLGFLDGKIGLIYCFYECLWYRFTVDVKIYEKNTSI